MLRSNSNTLRLPPGTTSVNDTEIRVRGTRIRVPSVQIDGRTVITTGKWLKIAAIRDEELVQGETIVDPETFIVRLKRSGLKADIFTFGQKLPDVVPRYSYQLEWDSLAVIPITTYSEWWQHLAKYDARAAIKKARKRGLIIREVEFRDAFVEGIVRIYNETPIRQGKPFWHYGKDFNTVKQISSTYLERSTFVGAYFNNELVGFIKMVRVGSVALTFHVISMMKHFDKKPTNALIAKAVEICAQKGLSHLVYGNFMYGGRRSSLTEFKERNGFKEVLIPRYNLPMTLKGKMVLRMRIHHGIGPLLPRRAWRALSNARALVWRFRTKS